MSLISAAAAAVAAAAARRETRVFIQPQLPWFESSNVYMYMCVHIKIAALTERLPAKSGFDL